MNLSEQIIRIKKIIYELSPQSSGVDEFLKKVQEFPELLVHLNFDTFSHLKDYIEESGYSDFEQLQKEVEYFLDRRDRYFHSEIPELERVVKMLKKEFGVEITVDELINKLSSSKETKLQPNVWSNLENTESNQIKKGEIKKVIDLAKKYKKQNPLELKKALLSGDYKRPLIVKFKDRYHLISGNTRLSTAAAIGIKPMVLIIEL